MDFDQLDKANIIYFPCKGKLPAIKQWNQLTNSKKIKEKTNYGILCGKSSNITVIDIDNKSDKLIKNGMDFWTVLKKVFNNSEELETPIVKTGRGGLHLYFKYNSSLKTGTHCVKGYDEAGFKITYAIDIRNDGGYVISAGSLHPDTKKKYKYEQDFDDCDPMEIPDWLLEALTMEVHITTEGIGFKAKDKPIKTPDILESAEDIPEISVELFRDVLDSLGTERAHLYDDWIKVCWSVGAIDRKFGWNNLDALHNFAKKSDKYDEYETEKNYEEGNGSIGLGSVWYWLKEDNPQKFKELYNRFKSEQSLKVFYYGDYKKLMKKHEEDGALNKHEVKEYLKGAFVKIDGGGNTRWLSRNRDDDDDSDSWELLRCMPFTDNKIAIKLAKKQDDEKDDKEIKSSFYSILQEFSVHPDFSIFDKLDFRPYLREDQKTYRDGEVFNLFNGFPHNPDGDYDEKLIEPVLHCMREVLSAGNEAFFNYYLRYLAHAVQYPDEKPGVAIIFITPQGLGKDMIHYDFLKRVFGHKLLHRVNDLSAITRKFNKKLEGKLITVIGEIRSYNNELDSEALKGVITDHTLNIEPKGKDPYEIKDFQRFIAHTNNSIPVGIRPDDRRFVIHKVSKEHIQSRDYYNKLSKTIKNPEVASHFFKFLAQLDLSDFDIRERPNTIAKQELQILTAPNVYRFMADVYTNNWKLTDAKIKDDEIKIHTSKLYDNYSKWVFENGEKNKQTLKLFKQKLEECDFKEQDKQFKLFNSKANGYKTSFTEMYECFKNYIVQKNNNTEDDEDEEDSSDED